MLDIALAFFMATSVAPPEDVALDEEDEEDDRNTELDDRPEELEEDLAGELLKDDEELLKDDEENRASTVDSNTERHKNSNAIRFIRQTFLIEDTILSVYFLLYGELPKIDGKVVSLSRIRLPS